ncbi:papilin-like isoform X3 [Perca fluviatilis]|uniref:papilin-like isoform X3 n=1 Tax=Perca fluviatilis TaxID=8168 RepID=UPI001962E81C|nr:papilin-like isoform X3 [Perca fluviatilis]
MEKAMILVSVLLLGWTWTLQGVPVDGDQVEPSVALADVEDATLLKAPLFNATEVCEQTPEIGPCEAYFPRYFYNSSSMSCQLFTYGGCGGNQNNFKTEKECMQKCPEEVCEQTPEIGPCHAIIPRYFYNSSSMSCQLFTYGGCGGNQNNFKTEKECMQRCPEEVCEQTPEIGPCHAIIPRYFYNSSSMSCQLFTYGGCGGNQNNFKTEKKCMQRCPEEVCEQTPEIGPCDATIPRYFYNSPSMSCQLFTYGGCGGNQNNFKTEKKCMQRCHTDEVCEQTPEIGRCHAAIPRYFYNSSSVSCQLFTYGGCGGNQNNFKTEKKCMQRCHTDEVCEQTPEIGPCHAAIPRYFYNSSSMSCQRFTYGGCGGNQNNFKTEKECVQKCPEDVCEQTPKIGPCHATIPRYFYNSPSMSCQLVIYGGCGGNQNNFKTEKECMQRCHINEVCEQTPKTGPCRAYVQRYFYNSSSMRCQRFTYGGCKGNQNNFKTEKDCMQRCH